MMKVLVVCPRYPYPAHGGDKLRIAKIINGFEVRGCNVDIYAFSQLTSCKQFSGSIFHHPTTKLKNILNIASGLIKLLPLQVGLYYDAERHRDISNVIATNKYDLVIFHLIRSAPYVVGLTKAKFALEMTDAISMNYKRYKFKNIFDVWGWVYLVEGFLLRRYELSIVQNFDKISLISEVDKEYMCKKLEKSDNFLVFKNGVDFRRFVDRPDVKNEITLAFIGNLTSKQNQAMVVYFLDEIRPLLAPKIEVQLRILGFVPERVKKKLIKYDRIQLVGNYEVLEESISGCIAGLCPMVFGAGVQNKILDYFSCGLPTISSTLGNEGIDAAPNKEILIANSPQEYADCIHKLVNDESLWFGLQENSRAYARDAFNWNAAISEQYVDSFVQAGDESCKQR